MYQKYALSFPEVDSPEVLGLHPNADLTYRQKSVNALLGIIGMTPSTTHRLELSQ